MRLAASIGLGLALASCTTSAPEPAPTPRGLVPPTALAAAPGPGAAFPDAEQLRLIETQPATAAALLGLTGRAIDAGAIGVASAAFGTWLGAQPEGPALSAEARSDATRLHAALIDHEEGDLAASLVAATLRHDPEDAELAQAYVATLLADGILAFLRAHASASWAPTIARELPTLATVGDLDDDAMLEQLATAMVQLGGVDSATAHAQLRAARELPR